jgi:hypothetical protein
MPWDQPIKYPGPARALGGRLREGRGGAGARKILVIRLLRLWQQRTALLLAIARRISVTTP